MLENRKAAEGREEAGKVCYVGLVRTHHPGGRGGGAKLGPASGVVGSAMLVTLALDCCWEREVGGWKVGMRALCWSC